jgi:hypothetical protein
MQVPQLHELHQQTRPSCSACFDAAKHVKSGTARVPVVTCMLRVANSTPMVDFDSRLNSLRVNLQATQVKQLSDSS